VLNEILDRLHAENVKLRQGDAQRLIMPLQRDLIRLADDWRGRSQVLRRRAEARSREAGEVTRPDEPAMADSAGGQATDRPEQVATICEQIAEDLDLMLDRHGAQSFTPEPGDPFDRHEHRAVGTASTGEARLDSTVSSVRKPGYRTEEKVLRFAEVVVNRLGETAGAANPRG
jgi:hypothetical protein